MYFVMEMEEFNTMQLISEESRIKLKLGSGYSVLEILILFPLDTIL